jgi:hypothetical protein
MENKSVPFFFSERELADRINEAKKQAVEHLNKVLVTRNRPPIIWDGVFG